MILEAGKEYVLRNGQRIILETGYQGEDGPLPWRNLENGLWFKADGTAYRSSIRTMSPHHDIIAEWHVTPVRRETYVTPGIYGALNISKLEVGDGVEYYVNPATPEELEAAAHLMLRIASQLKKERVSDDDC